MGNPTNFLCLKGVLYCFGIISVLDSAFLLKILSCTILHWIMIPVPHIPDTVAWGSHIIVFKFRVLSSGSDLFPWGRLYYTIDRSRRQMCKSLILEEFAHSFFNSLSEISIGVHNWPFYSFSMNAHRQMKRSKVYFNLAPIGQYSVQQIGIWQHHTAFLKYLLFISRFGELNTDP